MDKEVTLYYTSDIDFDGCEVINEFSFNPNAFDPSESVYSISINPNDSISPFVDDWDSPGKPYSGKFTVNGFLNLETNEFYPNGVPRNFKDMLVLKTMIEIYKDGKLIETKFE